MKVGFLFGAGVSLPCGALATDCVTDIVLRGEGVHRHVRRYSDGTYFLSAESHPGLGDLEGLERIRCFLAFLKSHADKYFEKRMRGDHVADYEDLYYLVTQLTDAVDEYENPAVSDLLEAADRKFRKPRLPSHSSFPSSDLYDETRRYIKGIVSDLLSDLQPAQNHLRQIVQAATDPSVSKLEIFTLNHDRLIERSLEKAGILFSNGFAQISEDLRCWDGRKFAGSRRKVRLSKLHGSVDWYPVRFSCGGSSRVCIATNGDVEHAHGPDGGPVVLLGHDHPEMLIGTFNKMLEYTTGIYADLFCAFRTALWALDRLVISGYSFGDKGVNTSIVEWTREDCKRRVRIIAPDASNYQNTARGAIRWLFTDCGTQITTMNTTFEKVTWQQILASA